jgi:Rrf2 family protein
MNMNLNRSVTYGMIAMGHIARQTDAPWVLTEEISDKYNLPNDYLVKIMNHLVIAGLLQSKRGFHGGYSLAKPAKEITLLEIIEAVDGSLKIIHGMAEQTNNQKFAIKLENVCYEAAEHAMAVLKKAKLSDLVK